MEQLVCMTQMGAQGSSNYGANVSGGQGALTPCTATTVTLVASLPRRESVPMKASNTKWVATVGMTN